MAIYPKIETRRAKRRNGAAYQHRRRRSLTGGHSVIAHGRRMEYQRSRSMFLTHGIARLTAKSWSDRASFPGYGSESPCEGLLRAAGCDARYRNPKSSAGSNHVEPRLFLQIWPFRIQIWTQGFYFFLLGQPEPLAGRFVLQAVHSKTRLTLLYVCPSPSKFEQLSLVFVGRI